MRTFLLDVRFALRQLTRHPGFALVTVATLALGIGATTAIFAVVDGVLLRPLPYPEPDRLVRVFQEDADGNRGSFSEPNFIDLEERSLGFEALARFQGMVVSVSGGSEPARVVATAGSRDFFRVMGIEPALGRGFRPEEQQLGAAPAVIVSHRFWQRSLGADPDLSSHSLRFQEQTFQVVGVMPSGFDFPAASDLWIPREITPSQTSRTAHGWQVVGRLGEGRSLSQVRGDASSIARSLKEEHGPETWMSDAIVVPLQEQMVERVRPALLLLFGAAGFLLLIACANVVNLLLVRAAARRRELAVRLALGAGRGRLTRQLLTEALVLCLLGGGLGVLLASWSTDALVALGGRNLPRADEVRLDAGVLLFTFGVSIVAALGLGLVTAWRASDDGGRRGITGGGRVIGGRSALLRESLVVSQISLALVLLIGAGLLGRSFLQLVELDPGYRTNDAVVMSLSLPPPGQGERQRLAGFQLELLDRLAALPGVESVGGTSDFPLGGNYPNGLFLELEHPDEVTSFEDFGRLAQNPDRVGFAGFRVASPGYFGAMEIPLVRGRVPDTRDGPDAPHVAVVSQSLAERQWPGEDPLGKFIQFGNMDGDLRAFTVIGVVGDVHESSLEVEPEPLLYGHYLQRPVANFTVVMVSSRDPTGLIGPTREIVRTLDPEIPPSFRTLDEIFATALADRRFNLLLLGTFGAAALLLALSGIYGVISFGVAQRRREIGVRVALGAAAGNVVALVVRRGLLLAGIGVGLGVAGAWGLTRFIQGFLYGVDAADPLTFGSVTVLLVIVALLGSYVPARRAARVDPMIALRSE